MAEGRPLYLKLLGGFQAGGNSGLRGAIPTGKVQALLARLALPPGRSHARDELAALLWGDRGDAEARSNLRQALFVLRRALPSSRILITEGDNVALDRAAVEVDVVLFERRAAEGTATALQEAAELYQGDLLAGLAVSEPGFEEWLLTERERLRELATDALAKLLVHQRSAMASAAALHTGLRLVALDPLQESVHRALMRLYADLGRRAAALRQYQMCVGILRRELGMEPEAETKQLYQELVRRQPQRSAKAPGLGRSDKRHDAEQPLLDLLSKDTPLIGREAERAQLRHVLEEAAHGHGSVVTVVGEAGIGKTSVLGALAADAIGLGARVLLGRCYESASILPFGPWVDAFRSGQTLDDEELLDELHPVWRAELARLLPEADTAGLPAPSDNQLRLFEGVAHLVESLAARRALVLMLEDIHWADEMSLRLLAFISRRTAAWRVLLLTTARKQELADASMARRTLDELGQVLNATALKLAPLSRPNTALLVRSLSRVRSDEAALTRLEEQVWAVSEGNPFVAVETMRALHEGSIVEGSTSLPLPKRVRDLIADRLARLSDRGRQLAAVAAVIGREFDFALLQRAARCDEAGAAEAVEELVRRGMLEGTDDRFDFAHDWIRAVISAELLLPQRKLLHRQIGAALEALHADDLETHSFALGTHYRAGEVWDKALHYLRQAGRKAAARSAPQEAQQWFEQALSVLEALPESPATLEQGFDIRLELRSVLSPLGEGRRALERLVEAKRLAERLNDDSRRGRVYTFMTNAHSLLGELDDAVATGTRALEIARRLGDFGLRVSTTTLLEQAHYYRGDYVRVIELATENLEAVPADLVHEHFGLNAPASIYDRYWLVRSLIELGRFAEAAQYAAEALGLAEPAQLAYTVGQVHLTAGWLHLHKGDWAEARALIEHGIAAYRTGHIVLALPHAIASSAWVLAQLGDSTEALIRLQEAQQILEDNAAKGLVDNHGGDYHWLGRAALLLGRLAEARGLGERAIEFSPCHPGFAAHAQHLLGDVATQPSRFDVESGETHYRQALARAELRGMRPLIAHCHLGLGKLHRRTGQREQALEHLTTATTMYREMGMTYWLEQAEAQAS
jgi:DNA-binding SARP family transcriptional activator/tetratricopeptide (TPR) repeat protein